MVVSLRALWSLALPRAESRLECGPSTPRQAGCSLDQQTPTEGREAPLWLVGVQLREPRMFSVCGGT